MWSLPPPDASETRHQWPQSSRQHPSVMDNQTAVQSRWQTFGTQPWREANHLNSTPQEQKSLNHIDPRYASGKKTLSRLRSSENLSSKTGATLVNSCNTHAGMPSTYEPNWRYSSKHFYESQTNSSIYDGTAVRDKPPTSTLPTVKSHPPEMCPNVTAPITELQSTVTINTHSFRSHSYPSRVVPENGQERSFTSRGEDQRNGAVKSSPEFSSMREPEEITKAQLEAARKKREMREQREREAREMREREERERREREIREREEREKKERKKIEPKENDERQTKWFGGERAPVQESPRWQCEHYQWRCLVKFSCCGIFYPCHRCHNTSGACDTDDRKANNATHVKCGICGHEEEINEGSQYCSGCAEQMSPYFCFICKHFTGVEKNQFPCDKCGICSTHKDKSFHCDVCNMCLDKQLEGKHKCRPNSGHDECCICLGDAFSGCQILPCSHKVHKECAIAMIQNGVRNCPICRHPWFSR